MGSACGPYNVALGFNKEIKFKTMWSRDLKDFSNISLLNLESKEHQKQIQDEKN